MDVSGATTRHLPSAAAAQPRLDRTRSGSPANATRVAVESHGQKRSARFHLPHNSFVPVDAGEPTGGRPGPSFGSVLRPYICYNRSYFVGWVGWTGMSTTGSVPAHCVPSENSTDST